jgi:hypothetical protein
MAVPGNPGGLSFYLNPGGQPRRSLCRQVGMMARGGRMGGHHGTTIW